MERDIEIIVSQFRNEASKLFLAIVEDFERHAKKLDRQWDENVFRHMQGRFVQELKKQLTYIAEKTISQYQGDMGINILRRDLTAQIEYYIGELLLKIRSM
ncbi:MAG: hypothetical protein KF746_07060 [Chitinophagaceae bacterium]|nr:hypothetical protein [Chitinophagaceae bacterium]